MAIHFTKQQIDEIEQALIARSKKDSSFPGADQLEGTELIPIIQNGANKVTTYAGLWSQVSKELREYVERALGSKVDKVEGKDLSENDFTDVLKDKLDGIEEGAEVNVNADWFASEGDAFIRNKPDLSIYATVASVSDIDALIPGQASTTNQLADKNFVNSSIATNTAEFRGTYPTLAELETVTADKNDYGFVSHTDAAGNSIYDRYKYNGENWIYEYTLNNSSFTAAQWASIESGITSDKVAKLDTVAEGAQVNVIEGVQVNGTLLPVVNKTVNVQVSGVTGDLRTEDKADQEFFYRKTANGELDWVPSTAGIERLKGKTLAWNQLVKNGNFAEGISEFLAGGGSISVSNNILSYAVSNVGDYSYDNLVIQQGVYFNLNHKYILIANIKAAHAKKIVWYSISSPGNPQIESLQTAEAGKWTTLSAIFTYPEGFVSTGEFQVGLNCTNATGYSVGDVDQISNLTSVDLTLLYGSEISGMTDAEILAKFEKEYPGYHTYDPGSLLSFNGHYLKTVGRNVWDEEWESGLYDSSTGEPEDNSQAIRAQNYIPVKPSTEYYFKVNDNWYRVVWYDANKNIISASQALLKTITSPSNAAYVRFSTNAGYGPTYLNDICINISDASFNGQYEPYKETLVKTNPTELASNGVQIFPYGLQSAGNVYDEVTETTAVKRIGRVDMGSLEWGYSSDMGGFFYVPLPTLKHSFGRTNAICAKYASTNLGIDYMPDKSISTNMNGFSQSAFVLVKDSAYNDAATFKAAIQGVMLNYELATPVVYTLDEPLDLKTVVDIHGTEQVYPENTSTPYTTPIRADIQYGLKSSQLLNELRIADSLRFERDFTVTDYSGDHSGEAGSFDGTEDVTLALPEVINGQVERNTEISRTEEFHFQPVPVSHFNDAYSIDKIYGKTLAWNQLVQNGNFVDTSGWTVGGGTFSVADNVGNISITNTPTYNYDAYITQIYNLISGHKYLINIDVYCPHTGTFNLDSNGGFTSDINSPVTANNWVHISEIRTSQVSSVRSITMYPSLVNDGYAAGDVFKVKKATIIDLTLLGLGDITAEQFEALYPDAYYPYTPGTLISNDAEAVETTGANQWDEEWGKGRYGVYGEKVVDETRIRSKNKIKVIAGQTYYVNGPISSSADFNYVVFDASGNAFGGIRYITAVGTITMPNGADAIVFYMGTGYGTTYNYDICINISDESFNGQYEPFWKKDLHLGLGNFKVKSPNIWDEEWEEGEILASTGQNDPSLSQWRTKNYIPIFPRTEYYVAAQGLTSSIAIRARFYDANKNYIGYTPYAGNTFLNSVFTTPDGAFYMRFCPNISDIPSGTSICINISNPAFNGRYFPYGTLNLEGGLKGAGSVYDEIRDGKYVKRIGRVDLGDLEWTAPGDDRMATSSLQGLIEPADNSAVANIICQLYVPDTANNTYSHITDKTISVDVIGGLQVYDTAYSDVATFKAAMNGVMLDYELAKEEVYDLAEPIFNLGYAEEKGNMRVIYEDETAPHVQFKSDITYGVNAGSIVDSAQKAIDSFKTKLETLWDAVFNNS